MPVLRMLTLDMLLLPVGAVMKFAIKNVPKRKTIQFLEMNPTVLSKMHNDKRNN